MVVLAHVHVRPRRQLGRALVARQHVRHQRGLAPPRRSTDHIDRRVALVRRERGAVAHDETPVAVLWARQVVREHRRRLFVTCPVQEQRGLINVGNGDRRVDLWVLRRGAICTGAVEQLHVVVAHLDVERCARRARTEAHQGDPIEADRVVDLRTGAEAEGVRDTHRRRRWRTERNRRDRRERSDTHCRPEPHRHKCPSTHDASPPHTRPTRNVAPWNATNLARRYVASRTFERLRTNIQRTDEGLGLAAPRRQRP